MEDIISKIVRVEIDDNVVYLRDMENISNDSISMEQHDIE